MKLLRRATHLANVSCPPAQLAKREVFLRRNITVRQSWRLNLANAVILCRVPVAQVVFYFKCHPNDVVKWCKAVHCRRPLGYTKWRHELDLYEIAGVPKEEFI